MVFTGVTKQAGQQIRHRR